MLFLSHEKKIVALNVSQQDYLQSRLQRLGWVKIAMDAPAVKWWWIRYKALQEI